MRFTKIVILLLALLLPVSMSAQKRKRRAVKKKPKVEEPQEDPRITNMREMTQQIVIIDSIVTDKDQFLANLKYSSEVGTLMAPGQFTNGMATGYTFLNEMGNKAYFSLSDDSLRQQLYTSDLLVDKWSKPQAVRGISDGIIETSYPFMLTDGVTLYFAGRGEESIGGYDIFFTRYDSHSGSFLKPENIGMPFNSEANDYMYVVDEFNQIGYFVSDRRQPEGKVCIYIFVPSESRQTYDIAAYTKEQLYDLSTITRISDTWGNGMARKRAFARLKAMGSKSSNEFKVQSKETEKSHEIIINDNHTYPSVNEFKSTEAANYYKQLVSAKEKLETTQDQLDKLRDLYHNADEIDKTALRSEILTAEAEEIKLVQLIKALEKKTRNAENKVIN